MKLLIYILLLLTASAPGQAMQEDETGGFQAIIVDPVGNVAPGASITVKNNETKVETKYTSNADGSFRAVGLTPGYYEIIISKELFVSAVLQNIRLQASIHIFGTIKLEGCQKPDESPGIIIRAINIFWENQSLRNPDLAPNQIVQLPLAYSNVPDLIKIMGGVANLENPIFGVYDSPTNFINAGVCSILAFPWVIRSNTAYFNPDPSKFNEFVWVASNEKPQ
jgi:hypothetical protein